MSPSQAREAAAAHDDLARYIVRFRTAQHQDRTGRFVRLARAAQRDHFLSVLSERARLILLDEIENMGPLRMRDVNDAQAEIVRVAKAMADDGTIIIPQSDDADTVVY